LFGVLPDNLQTLKYLLITVEFNNHLVTEIKLPTPSVLGVLFDNMLSNLNQYPVLIPQIMLLLSYHIILVLFPQQNLVFT